MAGPAYQWGVWRFEPSECRLLRNGDVVPLPAKTLDLLSTLLRRTPRLLTKEEILSAVWPDAAVEEGNIAFHVAALRKVLDEEDGPSAIETVRGRGYRFVHDVTIHQMPPTDALRRDALERAITEASAAAATALPTLRPSSPRNRRLLIALLAVVVIGGLGGVGGLIWMRSQPQPWSIAVQPFEIVDPPAGEENFPDGLRNYLKNKLELAGITTVEPDAATALLSGQLHPMGGGFRVTIHLSRTSDGTRVWDWSFDVPRDEDKPPEESGQDDERSRLQGAIATHAADGVARFLSQSR